MFMNCFDTKTDNTERTPVMILMDLSIDNFYAFKDFRFDLSYKSEECVFVHNTLKGRDNFRYSKVAIILGGNASGKTTLGQFLKQVFNRLKNKTLSSLEKFIFNKELKASFSMTLVTTDFQLCKVRCNFTPVVSEDGELEFKLSFFSTSVPIKENDTYEDALARLNEEETFAQILDPIQVAEDFALQLGWFFIHPDTKSELYTSYDTKEYAKTLDIILRALDPSIKCVKRITDAQDTFVIKWEGHDIVMQQGKTIETSMLSSGTKMGVHLANLYYAVATQNNCFYYCDEQFAFAHSEIEKTFLAELLCSVQDNHQLLYTTHNLEVLDFNLPTDSFYFLKKDNDLISCIQASAHLEPDSEYTLKEAVENDLFSCLPSTDLLTQLREIAGG